MQINRTTDYALRLLVYLGKEKRPVFSSELANNMKISRRYILSIARDLKSRGYINSGMGIDGGYTLAKPLDQITLHEIVIFMEGSITISRCLMQDNHCDDEACILHEAYNFLQSILDCYFGNLTLDALLAYPAEEWQRIIMDKLNEMHRQYPDLNVLEKQSNLVGCLE